MSTAVPTLLNRQHRTWIALYSLDSTHQERTTVLEQNNVTEADLAEFFESWFQFRCRCTVIAL
ncbi:hypothetical protein [Hymenobacter sp. UYP22]|uniref:hypothetical protein n=1 Tax=Hymenobacter sp. UYP22 TaxID=3156348 RepID=UPI0033952DA5